MNTESIAFCHQFHPYLQGRLFAQNQAIAMKKTSFETLELSNEMKLGFTEFTTFSGNRQTNESVQTFFEMR